MAQIGDGGGDHLRLHRRKLGGVDAFRHPRDGGGDDDVGLHAHVLALDRGGVGQTHEPGLAQRVVGVVGLAVEPVDRAGQDDPAIALRGHQREAFAHHVERALEVDGQHAFEIVVGDFGQGAPAHVAGAVDQHIDAAEGVEGGLDDGPGAFGRGDAVQAGNGLAPGGADFVHQGVSGAFVGRVAGHRDARVVDHDLRPARGEQQRIGPPEPAPAPGDHGDAIVEAQFGHFSLLI